MSLEGIQIMVDGDWTNDNVWTSKLAQWAADYNKPEAIMERYLFS